VRGAIEVVADARTVVQRHAIVRGGLPVRADLPAPSPAVALDLGITVRTRRGGGSGSGRTLLGLLQDLLDHRRALGRRDLPGRHAGLDLRDPSRRLGGAGSELAIDAVDDAVAHAVEVD